MKATSLGGRRRWMFGGAGVFVLAGVVVAFAFGVPEPQGGCGSSQPSDVASVNSRSFNSYSRMAKQPRNPVTTCRAQGGVCVGLEPSACARGPIGDAKTYSCGDTSLQCCLPEGRSSEGGSDAP